ncbi:MAG: FIST C-terminal domain-containing protein [Myxococcales bacterium]|nr:FIST C-terminal domain-containing protein [Myxococcales bacterium]
MAGREVAQELLDALERRPDLVLLFAPTEVYDHQALLEELRASLGPDVRIAGCTSTAEIGQNGALLGSVTAMGLSLQGDGDSIDVEVFSAQIDDVPDAFPGEDESFRLGRALGEQLSSFGPRLVMLFPDGVFSMPAEVIRGLQQAAGVDFPIVGGCAGEREFKMSHTAQFVGDRVLSRGAVAVGFRGPLRIQCAAGTGFQPLGRERICTKVEGKFVVEIDGEPALEMYRQLLGDEVEQPAFGIAHPLAMLPPDASGDSWSTQGFVIRAVQRADERGALQCGGVVHEGARVRITRATREQLLAGAVETWDRALAKSPNPELAFFYSCAGRKMILGPRHFHAEMERVLAGLPDELPRIGFYTYGELAPLGGAAMHHDETFTVVLMSRE